MLREIAICRSTLRKEVVVTDIILFPEGILNSKMPKVKAFWRCLINNKKADFDLNINVNSAKIVIEDYRQMMMIPEANFISVLSEEFDQTPYSLRRLHKNLLTNKNNKLIKNRYNPRVYKFSPEIDIWYSLSSNKNNPDKYRIKAYICEPQSQNRGRKILQRGERVDSSVKGNDSISKDTVIEWLKEEYPFANISRRTPENMNENIRDIISEHYRGRLKNSNISIRTLWYIYPEISSMMSIHESELLREMAMSSVGGMDLKFSSADDFTEELGLNYKDKLSHKDIKKLKVLSNTISFAINKGHCEKNVIDDLLSENSSSNKAFIEIRSALTKKSFTEDEQKKIYEIVINKIYDEHKCEYIGVLIKLLTGLESNIVCGLQWDDFILVEGYEFYKFNIYNQVTNNGKNYSGFTSIFDYRCVPCSAILGHHLCKLLEDIKMKTLEDIGESNIVSIIDSSDPEKETITALSPDKLNKICKDIVNEIGIVDVYISFSDNAKGTKETNLSRYGGDIL